MNVGTEFSFVGIRCTTSTSYDLYAVQDASFIAQPSIKRGSVRGRDEWYGTTIVSNTHNHQRNENVGSSTRHTHPSSAILNRTRCEYKGHRHRHPFCIEIFTIQRIDRCLTGSNSVSVARLCRYTGCIGIIMLDSRGEISNGAHSRRFRFIDGSGMFGLGRNR